jgi:hypothetical protein
MITNRHVTDLIWYLILDVVLQLKEQYVFVWRSLDSNLSILRIEICCERTKFVRNMYY